MVFNLARRVDILPDFKLDDNTFIEVVDEIKLLGVVIKSDLKWQSITRKVISNCCARMWLPRNLKKYGASEEQMIKVYTVNAHATSQECCSNGLPCMDLQLNCSKSSV